MVERKWQGKIPASLLFDLKLIKIALGANHLVRVTPETQLLLFYLFFFPKFITSLISRSNRPQTYDLSICRNPTVRNSLYWDDFCLTSGFFFSTARNGVYFYDFNSIFWICHSTSYFPNPTVRKNDYLTIFI